MLYGLNYSPAAAALLQAGAITLDRFKCPDWDDLIAEAQTFAPVYVHFPIQVGGGQVAALDFDHIERLLTTTDTPYVNAHLHPRTIDFPDLDLAGSDELTPAQTERVIAQMHADLVELVRRFGAERVIVENVPYRAKGEKNLRISVDPDILSAVVTAHNVGFLFDIAHAQIVAQRLAIPFWDYVERLPLARLTELHITGILEIDGEPTDHLHMSDPDWERLAGVLACIVAGRAGHPWIAAFEYGGISSKFEWRTDPARMRVDVPRMVALVKSVP